MLESAYMLGNGSVVDLGQDLDTSKVGILTISSALSKICRFNGHTREFYSVAEHSIYVASRFTDRDLKRVALLHDAAEAFIGDISRPLKTQIVGLDEIEERLWKGLMSLYNLPEQIPEDVREVDDALCRQELNELVACKERECNSVVVDTFRCWSPKEAFIAFNHNYLSCS